MQKNLQLAAYERKTTTSYAPVLKDAFPDSGERPPVESKAALYKDFSTCLNIAFLLNCHLLGELAECLDRSLNI